MCTPSLVQLRAIERRLGTAATGADPDAVFARSAVLIRQEAGITGATFDRIDALDKPHDGRGAVRAWVAANRRQIALTRALSDAFAVKDETRIAQLSEQVDRVEDTTTATARKLGMRACAERVDASPGG